MRNIALALSLLPFATLIACGTVKGTAEEQLASGQVTMPTNEAPINLGPEGMVYLYCGRADEGCFGTLELNMLGTSPDFPIQWDPAFGNDAFGTYTENGEMVFVTRLPWPSAGRGDAATPDAVQVAWDVEDGTDLAEDGIDDGWYNLPTTPGTPFIQIISDCGHSHPNIVWGWDGDGNVSLPANVASYGEDYCP